MKLSPVLLAAVSAEQTLVGPSSHFDVENTWPVQCRSDEDCSNSVFQQIEGWNRFDVKGLRCSKGGYCTCKADRIDADDNPFTGCELKFDNKACPLGSCREHGVKAEGAQCGRWKLLTCNGECCELDKANMPSIEMDGGDDCAERCKDGCSLLTDSAGRCVKNCITKCESNKPDIGPIDVEPIDPVKPIDPDVIVPTDPIKPTDPVKPTDPIKPIDPEDPLPVDPIDPVKPIGEEEPVKPDIVKPVDDLTTEEICSIYCDKNCGSDDRECIQNCNEKCLTGNAEKPPPKPIDEIKPDEVEVGQVCDLLCEKKCADAKDLKECMQNCGENCLNDDIVKPPTLAPPTTDGGSGSKPVITEIDPNDVDVNDVCELLCDKRCQDNDDPKCMDTCKENCIHNQESDGPITILPVNCEEQCDLKCSDGPDPHKCFDKCNQQCEDFNKPINNPGCETIRCAAYSECVEFDGKAKCVCIDGYEFDDSGTCICRDDWCQDVKPTIRPPIVDDSKCDLSILGDQVKAMCKEIDCYVKCKEGVPFFGETQVDSLMCVNGELYTVGWDEMTDSIKPENVKPISLDDFGLGAIKPDGASDQKPGNRQAVTISGVAIGDKPIDGKPGRITVDGPLECRVVETEPVKNPCRNPDLFKCPVNSSCHPNSAVKPGYTCECNDGYYMSAGRVCQEIIPIIPIDDSDLCPASFKKGLKKLKVSNLKNPLQYDGTKGSKLIQIETQIKNLALNSLTYTGFLEFNMENCGKAFIKAFSSNMIEFSVFDSKGSDGLYTVQGQKAVFFKDKNGSTSKAGGVIQITKNYPTLAAMTNDKTMLEINQRRQGGRYLPPRDTFLLSVQGDVINAEAMGEKEFAKCFNPSNLSLSIVGEKQDGGYVVYDQDYTKCFYRSKLAQYMDGQCKQPAVIDGELTEDFSVASVLFSSDFAECSET